MRLLSATAFVLTALALAGPVLRPVSAQAAVVESACGTPLSGLEIAEITDLSDPARAVPGDSLTRLEDAVDRHHRITEILVAHRDVRGVFALGLDAVEYAAVMPLQRDPGSFRDPEFAHAISYDLLRRFLDALHAEFTGAATAPHWARYFTLAADCEVSRARTAMTGYNAHLVVDLANAVAAVGGTPENAEDYFRIVATIAAAGDVIVERTKDVYGADLGPLWRFYFFGEGLDRVFGAGVATEQLLIAADLGANVVIFGNGLALQDPALAPATRAEIDALWQAGDLAFDVLSRVGGL